MYFPWLYTSAEHARVKYFPSQVVIFFMTVCAGVWHTVPLACYTQMSNSLCSKCVLAGGKKKGYGHRYGTSPCACVCVNVWPMLHRLRHSRTRRAAPFLLQPLTNTHSPRKLLSGQICDDISSGGPILQACRKWLAEEQTGRDSSEESLDGDSCYPGLSSTGEPTTSTPPPAFFRQRQKRWGTKQVHISVCIFSMKEEKKKAVLLLVMLLHYHYD